MKETDATREYVRKVGRKKLKVVHSTQLGQFYICPLLANFGEWQGIPETSAMEQGKILERIAFGVDAEPLLKGKRKDTVAKLGLEGLAVKKWFEENVGDGKPFVRIEHITESAVLTGEVDFFGDNGRMYDLKRLSRNTDYWDRKSHWTDFMQAVYYPYIYYKETGTIAPFTYVVFNSSTLLVTTYSIEHPETRFEDIEKIIHDYTNPPPFLMPPPTLPCEDTGYGVCAFAAQCPHGVKYLSKNHQIDLEYLS